MCAHDCVTVVFIAVYRNVLYVCLDWMLVRISMTRMKLKMENTWQ